MRADLESVAGIFTAGFVDDPWFRWLWPSDAEYAAHAALGASAGSAPDVPHFACIYVAVRPETQGQGVGESLMQRTLRSCDTDSFGAHLVSTNDLNLSFYRRLGFEVTADLEVAGGAVTFRPMWRDPSTLG